MKTQRWSATRDDLCLENTLEKMISEGKEIVNVIPSEYMPGICGQMYLTQALILYKETF